jgi:AcrR family transcriptional regulator
MSDTRARLLAVTAELFQRQGYNGTSMKQIIDGAEATTGSLYHFFPGGKDDLATEVILTSGAAYLAMFQAIASLDNITPANAMTMLFDGASATLEGSDFVDACPIFTVAHEVASANEPLRMACEQVFADWMKTATLLFRNAGVDSKRAKNLAATVVASIGGAFILARTARNANLMRSIGRDVASVVQQATDSVSQKRKTK